MEAEQASLQAVDSADQRRGPRTENDRLFRWACFVATWLALVVVGASGQLYDAVVYVTSSDYLLSGTKPPDGFAFRGVLTSVIYLPAVVAARLGLQLEVGVLVQNAALLGAMGAFLLPALLTGSATRSRARVVAAVSSSQPWPCWPVGLAASPSTRRYTPTCRWSFWMAPRFLLGLTFVVRWRGSSTFQPRLGRKSASTLSVAFWRRTSLCWRPLGRICSRLCRPGWVAPLGVSLSSAACWSLSSSDGLRRSASWTSGRCLRRSLRYSWSGDRVPLPSLRPARSWERLSTFGRPTCCPQCSCSALGDLGSPRLDLAGARFVHGRSAASRPGTVSTWLISHVVQRRRPINQLQLSYSAWVVRYDTVPSSQVPQQFFCEPDMACGAAGADRLAQRPGRSPRHTPATVRRPGPRS